MSDQATRHARPDTVMTEAEFLALPETLTRTELIDGVMVCEPSPGFGHQESVLRLGNLLLEWAKGRTPRPDACIAPLDVRFGPGRILQPDALVFLEPLPRPVVMPIDRVPDLCVEVVSSRRAHDRVTKRLLYAEAGVGELWTVLPARRTIERWTGVRLHEWEEIRRRLATPLLPGFELDVEAFFGS